MGVLFGLRSVTSMCDGRPARVLSGHVATGCKPLMKSGRRTRRKVGGHGRRSIAVAALQDEVRARGSARAQSGRQVAAEPW